MDFNILFILFEEKIQIKIGKKHEMRHATCEKSQNSSKKLFYNDFFNQTRKMYGKREYIS